MSVDPNMDDEMRDAQELGVQALSKMAERYAKQQESAVGRPISGKDQRYALSMEECDDLDELPAPPRKDISPADRELLELAASAIGARFEEVDGEGYGNLYFEDGRVVNAWNPLMFSGDAFELQVRLKVSVDPRGNSVCVIAGEGTHVVIETGIGSELITATRRAITRAAAEIGRIKW